MTRGARRFLLPIALCAATAGVTGAGDSWNTYRNDRCGLELRYPASYQTDASSAPDHCELWLRIGPQDTRGVTGTTRRVRALFTLDVREMDSVDREDAATRGQTPSAQDFAIQKATVACMADGPDGSTYCVDGSTRATFKTALGFHGYEIALTEVHESLEPRRTKKQKRGPIFAIDLSDDEVVRVLLAESERGREKELRAILDTLRVWRKARRQTPRVVEMNAFMRVPQAFTIRVTSDELEAPARTPPTPITSVLLIDPKGRRLGREFGATTWQAGIPAITQTTARENGFLLREPTEGRYEIEITATAPSVRYALVVQGPDAAGQPSTARIAGRTAEPGAIDRYEIVYAKTGTPAVKVAELRDLSRFTIVLSGARDLTSELLLTDPRGRPTGRDPLAKSEQRAIPRSSYVDEGAGPPAMVLDVRQPVNGDYGLRVTGTATGRYRLDVRAWDRTGTGAARPELGDVPIDRGVVHVYRLEYASTARTPAKLGGAFGGTGDEPDEVDGLLRYANPSSAETPLPAGVTTFPLVIFYGATIQPVTFSAMLNGDNISARFTPEPDSHEVVGIPVRQGVNTLVLSIGGVAASGATATDTDRLVFRLE
jgi:hypothetical protein